MEDTHRWSELIPPQTALTFAAMYDPNEGIITFSGGSLLDSEDSGYGSTCSGSSPSKYSQDSYAPREAFDDQSQVLTIDRLAYALGPGCSVPNSAALALEQGASLPFTFTCEALDSGAESILMRSGDPDAWRSSPHAMNVGPPRGTLYVVNGPASPDSEDSEELRTPVEDGVTQPQIEWSHLKEIGSKLLSAAKTPFDGRIFHPRGTTSEDSRGQTAGYDDGFFEDACLTATSFYSAPVLVNLNLKSTFSVTTASTSPFVHVSVPSVCSSEDDENVITIPSPNRAEDVSEAWRTPTLDAFEFLEGECPNSPREFRRRLRKMRRYPAHAGPPQQQYHSRSMHPAAAKHPPPICTSFQRTCGVCPEPASPEEVLARHEYNHISPCSPPCSSPEAHSHTLRPGLRRQKSFTAKMRKSVVERLTRLMPSNMSSTEEGMLGDERWVWVEVTHKVTQHVVSLPSSA